MLSLDSFQSTAAEQLGDYRIGYLVLMSNNSKNRSVNTEGEPSGKNSPDDNKNEIELPDSSLEASTSDTLDVSQQQVLKKEVGGPKGLEPTRYGDWESKGRCYDF